ncbi:RxLR effector protein CRE2 [Phytophthora ramorum]|uniref:RxLR effector protein CRE2 n=1 Tax=Phytophthora ramorum TaxID=164328 RepID=UPI0030A9298A|nr:RxLR effector protein CRE2 [Phytophthora ramorum]
MYRNFAETGTDRIIPQSTLPNQHSSSNFRSPSATVMRLLLWVLLVTLVTLLASTDAAPSKIANANTPKTSKLESIETPASPARGLSSEYIADGKRSLRVHANDNETNDEDDNKPYAGWDEEERMISISSILDRIKAFLGKLSNTMTDRVTKRVNEIGEDLAMTLYREGRTPISLQAMNMGSGNKRAMAFYKKWYDTNVAKGVIKALD